MQFVFPSFVEALEKGKLDNVIELLDKIYEKCELCPHKCGVNRKKGEKGFCSAGYLPVIASFFPHFGEETVFSGSSGSGTIFFSFCTLKCVFCQNYDISYYGSGREYNREELADIMIYLQNKGCHNINLVTPTHYLPVIMSALKLAVEKGLKIPLVYNCGGYESIETIRLLDGIVDIYLPDFKYGDDNIALKYSGIKNYVENAVMSIKEMYRQTGALKIDSNGIAYRGVLIRHLVLPGHLDSTFKVLNIIKSKISSTIPVNIMNQYQPHFKAEKFYDISRRLTLEEYVKAVKYASNIGLSIIN